MSHRDSDDQKTVRTYVLRFRQNAAARGRLMTRAVYHVPAGSPDEARAVIAGLTGEENEVAARFRSPAVVSCRALETRIEPLEDAIEDVSGRRGSWLRSWPNGFAGDNSLH